MGVKMVLSLRWMVVVALIISSLGFVSDAGASSGVTVSGRLLGLPRHQRGLSVALEAVSLSNDQVRAAKVVSGTNYAVRIPTGSYVVMETVYDPRRRRVSVAFKGVGVKRAVGGLKLTDRSALAWGATGRRRNGGPERRGGGHAHRRARRKASRRRTGRFSDRLAAGLPRLTTARSTTESSAYAKALRVEESLSQAGMLDFPVSHTTPTVGATIHGQVTVGHNGGPHVDIRIDGDGREGDPFPWSPGIPTPGMIWGA